MRSRGSAFARRQRRSLRYGATTSAWRVTHAARNLRFGNCARVLSHERQGDEERNRKRTERARAHAKLRSKRFCRVDCGGKRDWDILSGLTTGIIHSKERRSGSSRRDSHLEVHRVALNFRMGRPVSKPAPVRAPSGPAPCRPHSCHTWPAACGRRCTRCRARDRPWRKQFPSRTSPWP